MDKNASKPQSLNSRWVQGVSKLRQALELVETDMFRVHREMLRDQLAPENCTPETFLGDLTTLLVRIMPIFKRKKLAFLVDDFSIHRVPEPVQKVLNRVIWERRSTHIFKLSSEKLGAVLVDVRNASADLTREMTEIDCGKEYLQLEATKDGRSKASRFALDLLRNRLKAAGFEGDPAILIGTSTWPESSLAKALVSPRIGRREDQYHGIYVISLLCSGDVSSLLYVYRKIFERAGITKSSTNPIANHIQHHAIKEVSQRMRFSVQMAHPRGTECYAILVAFSQLVRLILREGRPQRDASGRPIPTQAPRIELDISATKDELTGATLELKRELLRRAIFIDLDVGTSRHKSKPTMRWQLRRIYLPAVGASLAKNSAIKRDYDWLKYFLTNPDTCCSDEWARWPRAAPTSKDRRLKSNHPRLPLGEP